MTNAWKSQPAVHLLRYLRTQQSTEYLVHSANAAIYEGCTPAIWTPMAEVHHRHVYTPPKIEQE